MPLGAAILSPYLRASLVDIRLAGASELPADRLAVRYGAASQQQFDGTLGTTLRLPVPLARGLVTPFARAEYHLRSSGAAQSSFGYADTPGGDVTLGRLAQRDDAWAVGAGARLALGPLQLMVEYAANCAKLFAIDTGTIKVHLGLDF